MIWRCSLFVGVALALGACAADDAADDAADSRATMASAAAPAFECASDVGGIVFADGFCAVVFADSVASGRYVAVREDGTVFINRRGVEDGEGAIVALRDTTGDGVADVRAVFGEGVRGSGIIASGEHVYADANGSIVRFTIPAGQLTPTAPGDTIVRQLPRGGHEALTFTLDGNGGLFVNVGSRTNSCQRKDRETGSPGIDPCVELETRAGIWRFDANRPGQSQSDGVRYATGIRNGMAMDIDASGQLWVAQHGRDQLLQNWPDYYTPEQSAENPGEELLLVGEGDDFGWPYCYHDRARNVKVLAPEYGGTGQGEVDRCAEKKAAVVTYPGHWAPMDVHFYRGTHFPARYRNGVFIVFHGSWNRAPLPQDGYLVVFQPLRNGQPAGEYERFADGFKGADELLERADARYRPVALAEAPDGTLYLTDDKSGRVWRITHRGNAAN